MKAKIIPNTDNVQITLSKGQARVLRGVLGSVNNSLFNPVRLGLEDISNVKSVILSMKSKIDNAFREAA